MNARTSAGGTGGAGVGGVPSAPLRLHAAMRRIRAFDARRPRLWDVLLPVLIAARGIAQIAYGEATGSAGHPLAFEDPVDGVHVPAAAPWLVVAGLVLPLLWRRCRPFAAFCAVITVLVVHDAYGLGLASLVLASIGVAVYNVALRSPLPCLVWVGTTIITSAGLQIVRTDRPDDVWRDYVPFLAIVAAIAMAGIAVRSRREYIASLVERAERLEVERDQRTRLAAAAERSRIAREMHDIVAHNLSVIVGLADGGAYAAARDPARSGQALEAISGTGRTALGELRRLLGVLQEDAPVPAALTPQPDLAELEPLLDRVRAAGLPVRCTVAGETAALSAGRQLTVYRVIQEALTNTLKHAGRGARAEVSVACAADGAADVTVTDTGGDRARPAADGDGQGVQGMRERAALYGGTLDAGPSAGGRAWQVRCTLPAGRPAAEEAAP
ncbi:sensor histidine kinase [Actinomadura sp. 1N219]|uniref:sensor histidine kinase n=1 Tax=Actinomadura sp. 1N219 TaxID=3375152 RepID=UPI0037B5D3E2